MPLDSVPIIDLDNHLVDDLPSWGRWIDDRWKDQLPREIAGSPDERPRTQVGQRVLVGSEIPNLRKERPNWVGTKDHSPRGRVALLDEAGIDVAVLSPSSSAQNFVWFPDDPALAAAYCRAQNAYMADYSQQFPDRFRWAGPIPIQDCDAAITELHRILDLGAVAVSLKAVPIVGREWSDPFYDPLYAELQRRQIPIFFHDTKTGFMGEERFASSWLLSHLTAKVIEVLFTSASIIFGGVLERFPELKLVFLETDTAEWPWWLARMDEHFARVPHMAPMLTMPPSEYFRRQISLACEPGLDRLFDWSFSLLGDANLVLGTDTPHWDAAPPEEAIAPILNSQQLSLESKQRILGKNAADLLHLGAKIA
jgi:predicted TIM-barrel fold metal-dependent hydrolase